ncbi:MAG: SDR family oxidoreductase [Planctomycetota bacterium]
MDFQDKRVLVLGGTSGIGLSVVQQLVSEGAKVQAASRNPARANDLVDASVPLHAVDVRDEAAMENLFAEVGELNYLVCTATGGERSVGPFLEMDIKGYKNSFDKLWGYANAVRYGTQNLTETGAIVLVSGAPARRAKPGQVSLASVGGAVEAFARTIAPEIAPRRINVVSPGLICTPMFGETAEAQQETLATPTAKHLIPRPGKAEEVADAILFLLKNSFVTGTTVDVDGGWLLS